MGAHPRWVQQRGASRVASLLPSTACSALLAVVPGTSSESAGVPGQVDMQRHHSLLHGDHTQATLPGRDWLLSSVSVTCWCLIILPSHVQTVAGLPICHPGLDTAAISEGFFSILASTQGHLPWMGQCRLTLHLRTLSVIFQTSVCQPGAGLESRSLPLPLHHESSPKTLPSLICPICPSFPIRSSPMSFRSPNYED